MNQADLTYIAQQFCANTTVMDVLEYGEGNVNDTYLVRTHAPITGINDDKFIMQRINQHVFRRPELILKNMRTFTAHVQQHLKNGTKSSSAQNRHWTVPEIIATQEQQDCYIDDARDVWRAITFVGNSVTHHTVINPDHAYESGYALGRFHNLLSDLDPNQLYDTLEGFHITPQYLQHYDAVYQRVSSNGHHPSEVAYCHDIVRHRREWASILEVAKEQGELQVRSIHGDPKVNNIMIDESTGHAISIVDLDTVKPGLVHYDIGDCLRSCCNPAGEETQDIDSVVFDTDLCRQILMGYLQETAQFFTEHDYRYIYDAARLISFELGLRFFADYLAGDVYFKTQYPEHNLKRACVQFKLVESIEAQEKEIKAIIDKIRQQLAIKQV
ncbi:MAG: aminoglycoside phosphotransferase family protein [Chloroflexota bacterium]